MGTVPTTAHGPNTARCGGPKVIFPTFGGHLERGILALRGVSWNATNSSGIAGNSSWKRFGWRRRVNTSPWRSGARPDDSGEPLVGRGYWAGSGRRHVRGRDRRHGHHHERVTASEFSAICARLEAMSGVRECRRKKMMQGDCHDAKLRLQGLYAGDLC